MSFYAVANGRTIGLFLNWNDCNNSEKIISSLITLYTLSSYYILLQVLKATATLRKSVVGRKNFILLHPTTSYYT